MSVYDRWSKEMQIMHIRELNENRLAAVPLNTVQYLVKYSLLVSSAGHLQHYNTSNN